MSKELPAFIFGQKEIERRIKKNVDNDSDKEQSSEYEPDNKHMG